MTGVLLGTSLIKDFPRVGLTFFGFLVSLLIGFWAWAISGNNDMAAYSSWVISFIIYMVLMYKLVFPRLKKKKIIKCKHCGREFDASDSLMCPTCFKTNAY